MENEDDNNRAELSAAATYRTSSSGSRGTTTPPFCGRKTHGELVDGMSAGTTLICPRSKIEWRKNQQPHVALRARALVLKPSVLQWYIKP